MLKRLSADCRAALRHPEETKPCVSRALLVCLMFPLGGRIRLGFSRLQLSTGHELTLPSSLPIKISMPGSTSHRTYLHQVTQRT